MDSRGYRTLPLVASVLMLSGCITGSEDVRAPVFEGKTQSTTQRAPVIRQQTGVKQGAVGSPRYYTVKPGDTLYSIAWREGVDYKTLADWNQLPADFTIHPGQRLTLTQTSATTTMAVPMASTTVQPIRGASQITPISSDLQQQPKVPLVQEKPAAIAVKPSVKAEPEIKKSSSPRISNSKTLRWRRPTQGRVIQRYKPGEITRKGIHIGGKEGQAVMAAESGKVVYSGTGLIGYGRLIIVKHNDSYLSAYGNNKKILVKEGLSVAAGEKIAEMGRSDQGKAYLYFEIRLKGQPVDPAKLLPR